METIEELERFLNETTQNGFIENLTTRGVAWSLMRDGNVLPEGAPNFGVTIETDLAEYAFSILRAALALKEAEGNPLVFKNAFYNAAKVFESLVTNCGKEFTEHGFYKVIAASCYHIAGYSATAYSFFNEVAVANITPAENALILFILRDFKKLQAFTKAFIQDGLNSDENVSAALEMEELDLDDALSIILNTSICRALSYFEFALATGDDSLVSQAKHILKNAIALAQDSRIVTHWWISRLCVHLIDDMWGHSLHQNLPIVAPIGGEANFGEHRKIFLSSLYFRQTAEVELWPSQLEAAKRSTDLTDDLIVALPTSAGKTRIAEIAALMTLATGARILIVTPLRALSAQTERSFKKTFEPLGYSVSSLYGASGSEGDEDALRTNSIVISTPEKIDFALRSDSSLIDDVGLVILDEGHMIGPGEREIRFEILVQRLVSRNDVPTRRIICLSAILPEGQPLHDLTSWIRSDEPGTPITLRWRPTRQRFGSLVTQGNNTTLLYGYKGGGVPFKLQNDIPFILKFIQKVPGRGRQTIQRPKNVQETSLFSAWKFAEQGKRVLIFSTVAAWVEGYGSTAVDLVKRGYLPSLLEDESSIERAVQIGIEWLGENHSVVRALKIGIGVHHGKLPNPFLRELEVLLSKGSIKVTVASPTLSQGLNINATVLLVPYLQRNRQTISGEEFANVAGRAGRAFVDVEGLVLHVINDEIPSRLRNWARLVDTARSRELRSGLLQIISEIITKLSENGILDRDNAFEYLGNSIEAWHEPELNRGENLDQEPGTSLKEYVEKLDSTVLGLIEALDAEPRELSGLLDEALRGSLWSRQIVRETAEFIEIQKQVLLARANLIWSRTSSATRQAHFAMGVGLESGLELDNIADEMNAFLDRADNAALTGDIDVLSDSLENLAAGLLSISPFIPNSELPDGWNVILRSWVSGASVDDIGAENMQMVEDAFAYRLVWALEALRIRRQTFEGVSDSVTGGASSSLESGVPQLAMSLLIRAGLPSRKAAIAAVQNSDADFIDSRNMRRWLRSPDIVARTADVNWPTTETHNLWEQFVSESLKVKSKIWRIQKFAAKGIESDQKRPANGIYRVEIEEDGRVWLCTPDYTRICVMKRKVKERLPGVMFAKFEGDNEKPIIERHGPGKLEWLLSD